MEGRGEVVGTNRSGEEGEVRSHQGLKKEREGEAVSNVMEEVEGVSMKGVAVKEKEVEGGKERVDKRHMVMVNISPITHGHCLLVPEPKSCLPQVN
jgi:hypothetical protein